GLAMPAPPACRARGGRAPLPGHAAAGHDPGRARDLGGRRRADRRNPSPPPPPALPPPKFEDRGFLAALREKPGVPPGKLFPTAPTFPRRDARPVRPRLRRCPAPPQPRPLRAGVRAVQPGLPPPLRRRRAA